MPTDAEWTTLTDYLGGARVAGGKLKEAGTAHWQTPNTGATNSTGFTALPGGNRYHGDGTFFNVGSYGYWCSSTAYDATYSYPRSLYYGNAGASLSSCYKQDGISLRCVRD